MSGRGCESALAELAEELRARNSLPAPDVRRALRKAAGATLKEVAQVVGVSYQAISFWEQGRYQVSRTHVRRYVETLAMLERIVTEGEFDGE